MWPISWEEYMVKDINKNWKILKSRINKEFRIVKKQSGQLERTEVHG